MVKILHSPLLGRFYWNSNPRVKFSEIFENKLLLKMLFSFSVFLLFANSVSWDEQMKFSGSNELIKINPIKIQLTIPIGITKGETCDLSPILQLVSRPNIILNKPKSLVTVASPNMEESNTVIESKKVNEFSFLNFEVRGK
jgi:hypothetical protein